MGMSGVRISDVARAAGVSAMTVSRVVTGRGAVNAETRKRVEAAVRQLGYVPNAAARKLATGQADRIGLIYSNPSAGYLSEFLLGALAGARRMGAQLIVEPCGSGEQGEVEALERLAGGGVKAVLLPPPHGESARAMHAAAALGMKVVTIGAPLRAGVSATVQIDDRAAAAEMTRLLLRQGHRKIGFVRGASNQASSALREAGFQRALTEQPDAEGFIEAGDFTYRSGLAAADRLLDLPVVPTAIFASNDEMASAVVAVAHRRGLDVPGGLSVVGFDDTAVATSIWPALTTVRQPVAEMAEAAVILLAGGGTDPEIAHVLAHRIVERESAAKTA